MCNAEYNKTDALHPHPFSRSEAMKCIVDKERNASRSLRHFADILSSYIFKLVDKTIPEGHVFSEKSVFHSHFGPVDAKVVLLRSFEWFPGLSVNWFRSWRTETVRGCLSERCCCEVFDKLGFLPMLCVVCP